MIENSPNVLVSTEKDPTETSTNSEEASVINDGKNKEPTIITPETSLTSPSNGSSPSSTTSSTVSSASHISDSEEEAVKAAASAMAAVAAAAASNSHMSPSAAANFARNTVKKQPLLSAHTSKQHVSPHLATLSNPDNNSQPAQQQELGASRHEVIVESLKVDLDLIKLYLQQQIAEREPKKEVNDHISTRNKKNDVSINGIDRKIDNFDENISTDGNTGETEIETSAKELTDVEDKLSSLTMHENGELEQGRHTEEVLQSSDAEDDNISDANPETDNKNLESNNNNENPVDVVADGNDNHDGDNNDDTSDVICVDNPNEAVYSKQGNNVDSVTNMSDENIQTQESDEEQSDNLTSSQDPPTSLEDSDNHILNTNHLCSNSFCKQNEDETDSKGNANMEMDDKTLREFENMNKLSNSNEALLRLMVMLSSTPQILPQGESEEKNKTDLRSNDELSSPATKVSSKDFPDQIRNVSKLVLSFYDKVQSEYDALLKCLPPVEDTDLLPIVGDDEDSRVVLDLLPPCTSEKDATSGFFRACSAKKNKPNETNEFIAHDDEINKEKIHVTSTEGGIEVSRLSSQTQELNRSSPTFSKKESSLQQKLQSTSSTGKTTTSAMSVVNAIAGAATGVVGGIMTGNSRNISASGVLLKKSAKKKNATHHKQPPQQNIRNSSESTGSAQTRPNSSEYSSSESDNENSENAMSSLEGHDYTVQISREMLGLTVENVLERTIVRTVLANGAAKKAGAKVGSLIVKVGSVETHNLTHFETIDELRQSQRPLKLVLRRVSKNALQGAREEMGRLIKGAGFGNYLMESENEKPNELLIYEEFKKELSLIWKKKRRFAQPYSSNQNPTHFLKHSNKKNYSVKLGERLAWILTLLAVGLEREAAIAPETISPSSDHCKHSSKELYTEAAKSVSKTLLDFVTRQFIGDEDQNGGNDRSNSSPTANILSNAHKRNQLQNTMHQKNQNSNPRHALKGKSKKQQLFAAAGRLGSGINPGNKKPQQRMNHPASSMMGLYHTPAETPLVQIGDVLHRLQPFLSDPFSPPAALLRGEVIALVCDVLDFDTEMELSDAEASSSTTSSGSEGVGAMTDLGFAGSLLKLIVRNCSLMKSPSCNKKNYRSCSLSNENEDKDKRKSETDISVDYHKLHAGNRFLAVVHRLAASRSTSARVTACSLGPVLWGHLDFPHQLQLRGVITRALHDVEVIVRKSTAGVLHEIAELVFDSRAVPWLVLMCERAMTDPEPQLRAAAMTLTWHLAEHLPNAFLGDASKGSRSLSRLPARTDPTFAEVYLLQCKLLPVATRLAEDRTFSVRLAVAAQCDRLCAALGDHWSNVIIDILQALLGDADERVRSEATLCLPRLVESVLVGSTPSSSSNGVLESLFPTALKLLKDPSASVRVSLATSSGELLTLLVGLGSYEELSTFESQDGVGFKQHKRHVDETLIPLVQRLLHDPDPEVTSAALRAVTNASRGNVKEISPRNPPDYEKSKLSADSSSITSEVKEPVFIPVLSEEQVLRLLPTLSDLATSSQWRVRQSAVEIVPALLGCTQKLETRSRIAQLCVQLMADDVDAVRRTAAECLCLGGGSLGGYGDDGGEWITAIVTPHLEACKENSSAKQRMLCLKMIEVMLKNGVCRKDHDIFATNKATEKSPVRAILEMAASLCDDRVVNVRLNVGRVLGDVVNVLDQENLKFVIEVLNKQFEDERARDRGGDRDVLYYAHKTVLKAEERLKGIN